MAFASRRMRYVATALALAGQVLLGVAEQVLVAELVDDIVISDLIEGGNCEFGCTREVHAVAHVEGNPENEECKLQTVSPFNNSQPEPGLLTASIYCEDHTGALIEQGRGPCKFEHCVDFRWIDGDGDTGGELEYDVVIVRTEKPSAAHTVYVDLSVSVDPTSVNSNVDSCDAAGTCNYKTCVSPTPYMAEIVLIDTVGDGWLGGMEGRYNTWTLYNVETGAAINTGTLADNHGSSTVYECLSDGEYLFNVTATAAFADDIDWNICETTGVAGEGLKFTISDGACDKDAAVKITRAEADETEDADFSYCTLPVPFSDEDYRTSACVTYSSGLKVDGAAMYYDGRCTEADYSGCDGRSVEGCRICFVDKELWMATYPTQRVPDWPMCPCCVASLLGVECATASGGSGTDQAIIIGVSVSIAAILIIAICLSCAFGSTILGLFRRMRKKKHPDLEMDLDINGAAAFPDSPGPNGTLNGNTAHRGRVVSGHFPIPRFDSIRGRFDSGIFASNNTAGYTQGNGTGSGALAGAMGSNGEKHHKEASMATVATANSSPSEPHGRTSPSAPRSTVLDGRLVSKGYTTSDVGRPVSGSSGGGGGSGPTRAAAGWGMAMSGEYPDLDGSDPFSGDNVMAETGTAEGGHQRHSSSLE